MPCRDLGFEQTEEAYRAINTPQYEVLLCSACRALANLNYDFGLNPELDRFWHKHQEKDNTRKVKEAKEKLEFNEALRIAEEKTLSQLTSEEKQLLKKYKIL